MITDKKSHGFLPMLILLIMVFLFSMGTCAWGLLSGKPQTISVVAEDHNHGNMTAWTSSTSLPNTSGSYYLTSDVTISSTWSVPAGTTDLCLNGHGIKKTGSGSAVNVGEGITLKLYDCDTITEHRYSVADPAANGAGLATVNDALTSNYQTFIGGYITGGNASPYGGGVRVGLHGKFEMFGGTIIGNTASSHGGGVCVSRADAGESGMHNFIMHGGRICYNKANWGGGIAIYGETYLTGNVEISDNVANAGGAGIELEQNGRLYMNCGIITDNVILAKNGGMWKGGGVHVPNGSQCHISGDLQIKNNYQADGKTNSNVFIRSGLSLTIDSALNQGAFIGVDLQNGTGTFTSGWKTYMSNADPADYFKSNTGYYVVSQNGEAAITDKHTHNGVTFTAWTSSNSLPNTSGSYYLTSDVTISSTWNVPSGTTNLCLNGHGIKMTGNNSVVTVKAGATLKLYDCDTTTEHKYSVSNAKSNGAGLAIVNDALTSGYQTFKGGYITGGRGAPVNSWSRGGAFYIEGTVEMYGGTVIGNGRYDNTHGGGFNTQGSGTFKMYGGSIQNNAGKCGGATRLQGTDGSCEIYGGKIINNIVSADGGAIHVGGSIPVILQNCEISGNYANSGPGAGIWMTTTGTEISGRTIITNNLTNSGQSNVEIGNGYVISVGELTEGASVGIKINNVGTGTFTSGWATSMGDADPADYFTSDVGYYVFSQNGEAAITDKHTHDGVTFTAWTNKNSLPTSGNYFLDTDVTISSTLSVSGTLNLCLNDHKITYSGSSGSVFRVNSGATLNLCDCGTTVRYYYIGAASTYNSSCLGAIVASESDVKYVNAERRGSFVGGYITGGYGTNYNNPGSMVFGGGVFVDGGSFTLNGGCIFGNRLTVRDGGNGGGGVAVRKSSASFVMNGGYIIGNHAGRFGGGIRIDGGSFIMNGGEIRHNTANTPGSGGAGCGGGIHLGGLDGGPKVTIAGGIIEGNYAGLKDGRGGGINVAGGSLTMTGGTVIGNNATLSGGGINGPFTLNGDVVVTGNTVGSTVNNVYLTNGKTITLTKGVSVDNKLGVTLESTTGVFTSGWNTYMGNADPAEYFTSDNGSYGVLLSGNEAIVGVSSIFDGNGTEDDPYLIQSADDWDALSEHINGGGTKYNGKYFKLTSDISVTTTLGNRPNPATDNADNPFIGTFDGDGHTLNVNISDPIFAAPFAVVHNATIKNLNVTGTVTSTGNHATGLVAASKASTLNGQSSLTIQNVTVSADISCNSHVAGIVGHAHRANITMDNVVFNGSISASSVQGGFIGWGGISGVGFTATMKDCLFLGTYRQGVAFYPIAYASGQGTVTLLNDFYSSVTWSGGSPITPTGNGQLKLLSVTVKKDGQIKYFDNISTASSSENWTDGSTLTLLKDVSVSSTIIVSGGTKTLDLNGHGIKMTGSSRVVSVIGATFILDDSNPTATHKYTISNPVQSAGLAVVNDSATGANVKTFTGGYITGASTSNLGAAVGIENGGLFTLNGGTLIGNAMTNNGFGGGAVYLMGYVNNRFVMNGGAIIGNTAASGWGGGIYMHEGASFSMNGGVIKENYAAKGGNGAGGGISAENASFIMTGGQIINNVAENHGGNINLSVGHFQISGKITVSGGKLSNGTNDNIYVNGSRIFEIVGALDSGTSIALTRGQGVFTSGWNTYMGNADPFDYFTSDNSSYEVRLSDGEAYVGVHVHNWSYSEQNNVITATCSGAAKGTCNLASQTFTISAQDKVYDGTPLTATVTKSNDWTTANGLIVPEIVYSGNTNVGDYTASVTIGEETVSVGYKITPASMTFTVNGFNGNYDGAEHAITVSVTDPANATVKYGTKQGVYTEDDSPVYINAGEYVVYYSIEKDNYVSEFGAATVKINKINATVTITGHNDTVDYDGKEHTVSGYDVAFSTELYTALDFEFSGKDEVSLTNAGTSYMGLVASQFANVSNNFATVTFNVTDGYITIEPINATVTITGHNDTVDYDGKEHTVSGYDVAFSTELYTALDFEFSGKDEVTLTNAGTSYMGLLASQFANVSNNFATVTFNVTDGYITVEPINATVTITGHNDTVDYDGKEHTVSGYDVAFSTELYTALDFEFSGKDEVTLTNAGTSYMGLGASRFANVSNNFATVTFDVTEGYIIINTVDAIITTMPTARELVYNGMYQGLITLGEVEGGTLLYALSSDPETVPADDREYGTIVPSARDVGYYYVWYKVISDANHNDLAPVYVKVSIAEDNWSNLHGVLFEKDGVTPIVGALVTLMKGNQTVDWVKTDESGRYEFDVPNDVYNIVTEYDNIKETTFIAFFEDAEMDIVLSDGKTESILNVKADDENDFGVAVGGLNEEAQAVREENPSADSVAVVMAVEQKAEDGAADAATIAKYAEDKSLSFFEIKVEKTVDSVTTTMDETDNIMEIAIPYEKTSKRGITVYSYHYSQVRAFVESDSKEDGTFRVDKENKLIYVYANKFSTYAIGYTPYYRVQTSFSLGSYTGKASVTLQNNADENISFALNGTDVSNLVFPDVPKGQYTMTVTWEDGITNTLKMTLTVGPKVVLSPITEQEVQTEDQEAQGYAAYIDTDDGSEFLSEDKNVETGVIAESKYEATVFEQMPVIDKKAKGVSREIGLIPRKRDDGNK